MPISESVPVAVFIVGIVFLVLFGLFLCIRLCSFVLGKTGPVRDAVASESEYLPEPRRAVDAASSGQICLNNVDEKTAAMLMAIVAHETGIPLSELRFQSIRQLPLDESCRQNQC